MANPAHQAQQRIDQLVAAVKAGAVPLVQPAKPGAETADELADDLRRIARLLDKLGDALANDPATVATHGVELQNLDIAQQTLAALADAAQPDAPGGGAGRARLGELRTSCLEALRGNS
jgi:predicted Zn-ribbon and HTH transcriptional regulator